MLQTSSSTSDLVAFRWAPRTLYHTGGHDVDAVVLRLLDTAVSQEKTTSQLQDLCDEGYITNAKHQELLRLVLARAGAILATGLVHGQANQQTLRSPNESAEGLLS